MNTKNTKGKVKKILVVEDDLALRPLWENFFKNREVELSVDWAVSSEEALKMIHQANENHESFFLIITDIFLAGSGTGMELIQSDEVLESKAQTVLISAADRNEIVEKYGHLIPSTIVISKPLDFKKYEPIFKRILTPDAFAENRKGA